MALDELKADPQRPSATAGAPQATASMHLAMVELAVASEPRLAVDDRELKRDKPSFTDDPGVGARQSWRQMISCFSCWAGMPSAGCRPGIAGGSCWCTAISSCCSGRMPTASRPKRCAICRRASA